MRSAPEETASRTSLCLFRLICKSLQCRYWRSAARRGLIRNGAYFAFALVGFSLAGRSTEPLRHPLAFCDEPCAVVFSPLQQPLEAVNLHASSLISGSLGKLGVVWDIKAHTYSYPCLLPRKRKDPDTYFAHACLPCEYQLA